MKIQIKYESSYLNSRFVLRSFKIAMIAMAFVLPPLLFFQNCAQLTYESPINPDSSNGVLGSPTGGTHPVGGFAVSGVTGDADTMIDSVLGGGRIPTFQWTEAINATSYELVVKQGSTTICQAHDVHTLVVRVASCVLNDSDYEVYVTAIGDDGKSSAPAFPFTVEDDRVELVISTPQNTGRNSTIPYTIKKPEDVSSLVCQLVNKKTNNQVYSADCTDVRQITYKDLPYSDYIFIIRITDKTGGRSTRQKEFSILAPNCDPLSKNPKDEICEKRLKANVYFHPSESGAPFWDTSGKYISDGILKGTVFLSDIFIPTREFSLGFPGISERNAFFGLDITTKIKPSDKMPAGNYQLALLVDDGASLYSIDDSGIQTIVVENEGDHPTQLRCASKPFALTSKVNMRLTYFQSRPNALALVMLYRPWSEVTSVGCPTATDKNYFGAFPVPINSTSWPGSRYQSLLNYGWKPVPLESFENPDL